MHEYIECIFVENLVISYITIYQMSIFTKIKLKKLNIIIGSLILSFYETISYYFSINSVFDTLIRLLAICFILYMIFLPNCFKTYCKIYIYYILVSFILVGIVISLTLLFNINISNCIMKMFLYIISGLILYAFNKLMWKIWKSKIKTDNLIYEINIGDMIIPAFIDTGNNVKDLVSNVDVIFIEDKYYEKLYFQNYIFKDTNIYIYTVAGEKKIKGYFVKDIIIKKNKKKICSLSEVIFVFVNRRLSIKDEYEALISYDTYLEKMKGVELC